MSRTYILAGLSGHGKSTTGNALCNAAKDNVGSMESLTHPFPTSDSSMGCTREFQWSMSGGCTVLDTVGFADPSIDSEKVLHEFKRALNSVDNKIDCVIFMVSKVRFTKEVVEFFKVIQEGVFQDKCFNNSILIVSGADTDWVRNQIHANPNAKEIVDRCNNNYYGFELDMDKQRDSISTKSGNLTQRKESIKALVTELNKKNFKKLDLAFVQTSEYEVLWYTQIIPAIMEALKIITQLLKDANEISRTCRQQ